MNIEITLSIIAVLVTTFGAGWKLGIWQSERRARIRQIQDRNDLIERHQQVDYRGIVVVADIETEQSGRLVLVQWPEGYLLRYHGEVVWRSWRQKGG